MAENAFIRAYSPGKIEDVIEKLQSDRVIQNFLGLQILKNMQMEQEELECPVFAEKSKLLLELVKKHLENAKWRGMVVRIVNKIEWWMSPHANEYVQRVFRKRGISIPDAIEEMRKKHGLKQIRAGKEKLPEAPSPTETGNEESTVEPTKSQTTELLGEPSQPMVPVVTELRNDAPVLDLVANPHGLEGWIDSLKEYNQKSSPTSQVLQPFTNKNKEVPQCYLLDSITSSPSLTNSHGPTSGVIPVQEKHPNDQLAPDAANQSELSNPTLFDNYSLPGTPEERLLETEELLETDSSNATLPLQTHDPESPEMSDQNEDDDWIDNLITATLLGSTSNPTELSKKTLEPEGNEHASLILDL